MSGAQQQHQQATAGKPRLKEKTAPPLPSDAVTSRLDVGRQLQAGFSC